MFLVFVTRDCKKLQSVEELSQKLTPPRSKDTMARTHKQRSTSYSYVILEHSMSKIQALCKNFSTNIITALASRVKSKQAKDESLTTRFGATIQNGNEDNNPLTCRRSTRTRHQ